MGIKRRYKRLRYYCSWKYPGFYRFIRTITFPVQVLALCLALYAVVTFYQNNFSFEASMRAQTPSEASLPERSIVTRPDTRTANNEIPAVDTADSPTTLAFSTATPTETEVAVVATIIEPALTPPTPTGTALIQRSDSPVAQQANKPEEPAAPLPTELPEPSADTVAQEVFDIEWLTKQRNNQFVVQLATSSRYAELLKYAKALPVDGPLVIYPYKKNTDDTMVYGLSIGLHNSIKEATAALETLPRNSAKYGYWIRGVATIKSLAASVAKSP